MPLPSPARAALAALAAAGAALALAGCGDAGKAAPPAAMTAPLPAAGDRGPDLLRGSVRLIDGRPLRLASLRGRVVLVVNTASRCGYTPQFAGLEALHRARRADGLAIVGFPSNDFNQELTGDAAIARFCSLNYGVTFPMTTKSHVTGASADPLFAAIAARPGPAGAPPSWNFTKYLLDRSGRLVARYDSSVEPGDPALGAAIDGLAAESATPR
jgi:glutathione peroxidase